jgi:AcrR family transcriptional regulator
MARVVQEPPLRSDARRNVERLLDMALGVLGENPSASVEQIAAAAQVHRSTVYRRFPSREALVHALLERAREEAVQLVEEIAGRKPTEAALRAMFEQMMALGERYAFLDSHYHLTDLGTDPIGLTKLIRRYQRAGVLRGDVPAAWLASALTAIGVDLIENRHRISAGDHTPAELMAELFLGGARAG